MKRRVAIIMAALITTVTFGQIDRVEPPSWWTGMKNSELQLMVHGEKVSDAVVSVEWPGIVIKDVHKAKSPNYLFIDLNLESGVKPGIFDIVFTYPGGTATRWKYTLKERDKGSSERIGFNTSDVIYLLMPDRFANGDKSNDEVEGMKEGINRNDPTGRHGGDVKGISDNLEYLKKLGFTSIWLNPILENNQTRTSYHGYATTDFYRVDPRYGSNEEYAQLGKKLESMGMKMIMDMIFNHCGNEHWWMDDLPFSDWLNFQDGYVQTNHRRTVNQDPNASEYDKKMMTDGWFVRTMPDLNQKNPFMAKYLIQNSIWWIEYAGLAGIRMDTYPYPDKYMMAEWNRQVLAEYPHFNIVGEEWSENPAIVSYWQRGQKNRDGYDGLIPSMMDFPLQMNLVKALNEKESHTSGWAKLYETLASDFLYPDPKNLTIFPDNHDMPRFYMQVGMDTGLYKLGIAYILTTRGIPQIYYGSEILMTHKEGNDHGYIRKDFPGGWEGDVINGFTGKGLSKKEKDMQKFFSTIQNWRKDADVIHNGKMMHFVPDDGIYVFFRYNKEKSVMVILNKNRTKRDLPLEQFMERLEGYSTGRDIITGKSFKLKDKIEVPGKDPLILELSR